MAEPTLSFDNLGYSYVPGRWVFHGYSGCVHPGNCFVILGPNGRGKTTLLKTLLGMLKPTAGRIASSGRIAFVPQHFHPGFDYSVLDIVLMGRARQVGLFSQPTREDEAVSLAALDRFHLATYARRPFHELSGGQRQLVFLSRALVAGADILILDEPTSALDLKNQALILDWIARLTHEDGLTVLFTTHHPHHALAVGDSALLMLGTTEYVSGPAREVLTEANLEALYGVPLKRLSFEFAGVTRETLAPVFGCASASRLSS